MSTEPQPGAPSERAIVYLMAGVQFVNVLDFMMVNPLGPDLAESLAIPTSLLAAIAGTYTAAASVSGLASAFLLDRFDRRAALVLALVGLALGTALGGFATDLTSLLAARVVAGIFGGPATSLAFAIVADAIPGERRGWAMGIVMGGFAVASVLGVPTGLKLAERGGFRLPFFGVGGLILVAAVAASRILPRLDAHVARARAERSPLQALYGIVKKPVALASLSLTALTMMSGFILIPNIAAFAQFNLGFPREHLDRMYLLGGLASLVTTRLVGPLVDRFGSTRMALVGALMLVAVTWTGFVSNLGAPVLVVMTAFFVAMSFRGVSYNTLVSKVPLPHERARFQSVQSAVQHGASAAAAFVSSALLSELPDHRLVHVDRVAWIAIALSLAVPVVMLIVERTVHRRDAATE